MKEWICVRSPPPGHSTSGFGSRRRDYRMTDYQLLTTGSIGGGERRQERARDADAWAGRCLGRCWADAWADAGERNVPLAAPYLASLGRLGPATG